ncbi:hypothetical protein AB0C34_13600 [Nocardia sp. NPDC049220]|uniref:hypothetical protein n=1 Tax=Nocardia sp. NPDC049220 TaxID=3155273 RepID=UPI003408A12E
MQRELCPHGVSRYTPGDPAGLQPQRGDVVMWGHAAHVTVATGRTALDGSPEVYSFWPAPKHEFTVDPVTGAWDPMTTDAVQITSINELEPFVNPPSRTPREIFFGRGPW